MLNCYIVYPDSGGSREDCSVFYSFIVFANSEEEAIQMVLKDAEDSDPSPYMWKQKDKDEWLELYKVWETTPINYTGL